MKKSDAALLFTFQNVQKGLPNIDNNTYQFSGTETDCVTVSTAHFLQLMDVFNQSVSSATTEQMKENLLQRIKFADSRTDIKNVVTSWLQFIDLAETIENLTTVENIEGYDSKR